MGVTEKPGLKKAMEMNHSRQKDNEDIQKQCVITIHHTVFCGLLILVIP